MELWTQCGKEKANGQRSRDVHTLTLLVTQSCLTLRHTLTLLATQSCLTLRHTLTLLVTQSCLTLRHHGLQPTRLLCPRDFPGKNNGVGCHFLLQGIFLTQESNPHLSCISCIELPAKPIDSQWEFALWLRKLKQGLCINLEGWDGEGGS